MAQALICATSPGAQGIYHVSDGNRHTMESFCQAMSQALGKKAAIFHIPLPVMAISAFFASLWGQLCACVSPKKTVRAPNWNLDKYREAREAGWVCDCSRLMQDTGFSPKITLSEGMRESVEGYRQRGWL